MAASQMEGAIMKKLIAFLLLTSVVWGQNPSGIQFLPGSCQTTLNKTCTIYRMPDSINAYKTDVTDGYGIYDFRLWEPGVYWRKLQVGTTTFWTDKSSYTPWVPIGGDSLPSVADRIQEAIDSLPASGGIIYLPPGTHLIGAKITVGKNNVTIQGTGNNCILKCANSLNDYAFAVSNGIHDIVFKDFVLNGNKGNQTSGGGFNVNGSTIRRVRFENLRIRHTYDAAIVFANGASDCDVNKCFFDSIGTAGQTSTTAAFPVYIVTSCSNIRITDNTFTWWSGTAGVRVNNNCSHIDIDRNFFRGNDRTGSADRRAIFADSGATGAGSCSYLSVTRNDIFDIDENGIFSNNNNIVKIEDNYVDSVGTESSVSGNGIECNDNWVTIKGNTVRRAKKHGISCNNSIALTISENNVSYSYGRGIYVFAASGDSCIATTIDDNTCWNNSISGATADPGIEVQGQDAATDGTLRQTTIVGNTCFDLQGTQTQSYGISVAAATTKCQALVITGNNVGRNLTGAINDGSDDADDVIANNQTTP